MRRFITFNNLLVIFFIILGTFLRFYKLPERTMFDADQEWIAYRAKEILNGDLALLGPKTSVGDFSIGPGYVYLTSAVSYFFDDNPISGAVLSVILGVITVYAVFLFTNKFIDKKVSFILLFLTSISFNLITWDQSPWAPSLFFISQIVFLWGAYISKENDFGYLLMTTGFILGFQSHFGIFLSFLSIFNYLVFVRPVKPRLSIVLHSLCILFVGLSPNILFDITHNFINIKRILEITKGDGALYFVGFGKIINTLAYNVVSLVYPRSVNILDSFIIKGFFALILVNCISLLRDKNSKKLALLLLITTIFPSLFFYIQQGKFSEYYLMMTIPSLIFMLGFLLKKISEKRIILIIILVVATYLNFKTWYSYKRSWSLKSKIDVTEFIISKGGKENYGISLSIKPGDQFGFKFIFDYYGIKADIPPQKGETKIFSIILPDGFDGMRGMKQFDGIGLIWQGI